MIPKKIAFDFSQDDENDDLQQIPHTRIIYDQDQSDDKTPIPEEHCHFRQLRELVSVRTTSHKSPKVSKTASLRPIIKPQNQISLVSAASFSKTISGLHSEPINDKQAKNPLDRQLNIFGIDSQIVSNLRNNLSIIELYEWQNEFFAKYFENSDNQSKNWLISAQTATGKSLVADLCATHHLCNGQQILYVEPLVALAQQRMTELQQMYENMNVIIQQQFRSQQATHNPYDPEADIVVSVIEKALVILQNYKPDQREIGIVVLDEIHYCTSGDHRGVLYELLASKCLQQGIQIIAFSATIPDINLYSKWLHADTFIHDKRDIPLDIQGAIIEGNKIKFSNLDCASFDQLNQIKLTKDIQKRLKLENAEFDSRQNLLTCKSSAFLKQLVENIQQIEKAEPTLIFCMSKLQCEFFAVSTALAQQQNKNNEVTNSCNDDPFQIEKQKNSTQQEHMYKRLNFCLQRKIAFHHSELDKNRRDVVESLVKKGEVRIIFATTTLSQGVNLPIKLVIIYFHFIPDHINMMQINQMAGRAGRCKQIGSGKCIIVIESNAKIETSKHILNQNCSSWSEFMIMLIQNIQQQRFQIEKIALNNTLYYQVVLHVFDTIPLTIINVEQHLQDSLIFLLMKNRDTNILDAILQYLMSNNLIKKNQNLYTLSLLGIAVRNSSLQINEALSIYNNISQVIQNIDISTDYDIIRMLLPESYVQRIFLSLQDTSQILHFLNTNETPKAAINKLLQESGKNSIPLLQAELTKIMISTTQLPVCYKLFFAVLSVFYSLNYPEKTCENEELLDFVEDRLNHAILMCNTLRWQYASAVLIEFSKRFVQITEALEIYLKLDLNKYQCQLLEKVNIHTLQQMKSKFKSQDDIYQFFTNKISYTDIDQQFIHQYWQQKSLEIHHQLQNALIGTNVCFIEPKALYNNYRLEDGIPLIMDSQNGQLMEFVNGQLNEILSYNIDQQKFYIYYQKDAEEAVQKFRLNSISLQQLIWYLDVNKTTEQQSPSIISKQFRIQLNSENIIENAMQFQLLISHIIQLIPIHQKRVIESLEVGANKIIIDIQSNLIQVDSVVASDMINQLKHYMFQIQKYIDSIARTDLNSQRQVFELLFNKLNVSMELFKSNKTNSGYSTRKEILMQIRNRHPAVGLIIGYRTAEKLLETLEAVGQKSAQTQRLTQSEFTEFYPKISQTSSATGRITYYSPPLQVMANPTLLTLSGLDLTLFPQKSFRPEAEIFNDLLIEEQVLQPCISISPRSCIVPHHGYKLLKVDFAQFELRLFAHFAKEEKLIQVFKQGTDPFNTLSKMLGADRALVKKCCYAYLYGASSYSIALSSNQNRDRVILLIEAINDMFPCLQKFISHVGDHIEATSQVESIFGRTRTILHCNSKNKQQREAAHRAAVNTICQSSAADLCKLAMIRIEEKLKLKMLIQMHDEIIFEVPQDFDKEGDVCRVMSSVDEFLEVNLVCKASYCNQW